MAQATWQLLEELDAELRSLGDPERASRAARILAAIGETATDVLRTGRRSDAVKGAEAAKGALDDVRELYQLQEDEPASIAGRLAMLTDMLAIAASRRAPDDVLALAKQHLDLLKAVHGGAKSNKELAVTLGVEEETACRQIRKARASGLIEYERNGRQVENRVSDLVLALDEGGLLALTRAQGFSMTSVLASTPAIHEPPKKRDGVPQLQVSPA